MVRDRSGNTVPSDSGQDGFLRFLYGNAAGRVLLKLMASRPVSVLVGGYMNSFLSVPRIKKSMRAFGTDLSELEKESFDCYNAFFTRKKKAEYIRFDQAEDAFCAPADSKLTVYPLTEDGVFTVKGVPYTAAEFLQDETEAQCFFGGYAFVFRLSVDDYHRYSYPDDGEEVCSHKIPGEFHTVNPIALEKKPVFHRNTREVTILNTLHFGKLAFVEVGAMLVGRIVNEHRKTFRKGEEKGYFEFGGSTVVLLTEKGAVLPDGDILKNSREEIETKVSLGESVGRTP